MVAKLGKKEGLSEFVDNSINKMRIDFNIDILIDFGDTGLQSFRSKIHRVARHKVFTNKVSQGI